MTPEQITWLWLFSGIALIGLELFIPGLVVSFLGLAAIIVAGFRWLGFFTGFIESFTAWFVTSIILLLGLRHFVLRWVPAESTVGSTDEDVEAVGTVVDVVTPIGSGSQEGRIRFGGTTWPALAREGTIPAGTKARLLYRDNLIWIVEPIQESLSNDEEPSLSPRVIKEGDNKE